MSELGTEQGDKGGGTLTVQLKRKDTSVQDMLPYVQTAGRGIMPQVV